MDHAQEDAQDDAIVVASQACTEPVARISTTSKRGQGKRFECTHPGCDKRFTRMEHMQRHALNHTAVDSTCLRCNAVFKRPDLLERHMSRHQQRDAEAGGPGHGTLDTRKRAWKGPDGTVLEKRPRTDIVSTTPPTYPGLESSGQVVSPPLSDEGRYSHVYNFGGQADDDPTIFVDNFEVSSSLSHNVAPAYFSHSQYDGFPLTMSSPTPKFHPTYRHDDIDHYPAFQPDTASSFNMPYTTALDYNWLFNLETATAPGFGLHSGSALHDQMVFPENTSLTQNNSTTTNLTPNNHTPQSQSTGWRSSFEKIPRTDTASTPTESPTWAVTEIPSQQGPIRDASATTMPQAGSQRTRQLRREGDCVESSGHLPDDAPPHGSLNDNRPSNPEYPLSLLRSPVSLPQIHEETRDRLLSVIETAGPQNPEQSSTVKIRDHLLLSLSSLQSWLDLFFTQFNTTYPLIHMPSFDPNCVEPLHLLSMILLGATYSDKSAHQLAVCIHDVIRPSIFSHAGFSPAPELWTLQTILLVECFGKSRAGQKQHDMSHLFHGLLINLIRRSDCQSIINMPSPPKAGGDAGALNCAWRNWAVSEQKKRLALLCFMWDTQHAVLFCQSLCMSAFELRCTMPCDQSLWEAPTAECWANSRLASSSSAPSNATGALFLPTLKAYLAPRARTAETALSTPNILSLVLVLHGIMSISWDMQRRDQTSLGVSSTLGVSSWRDMVSKAYDSWKVDFDQYCRAASAKSEERMCAEWSSFHAAYSAIYHAAQTLLHMDFLDVQIYAGARSILGRPVQQRDYLRSSKIIKRWATSDRERAAIAAYHAATMLSTVLTGKRKPELIFAATDTNLFHVPWCLYLATLTCWAFHHARPSRRDRSGVSRGRQVENNDSAAEESDSSDEIVWDSYKEMEALVNGMAVRGDSVTAVKNVLSGQGRRGTHGMVWVVADVLSKVRWGIVHAGVVVLRGLVPMRLINQYETI